MGQKVSEVRNDGNEQRSGDRDGQPKHLILRYVTCVARLWRQEMEMRKLWK
jgi:hypothetical protein